MHPTIYGNFSPSSVNNNKKLYTIVHFTLKRFKFMSISLFLREMFYISVTVLLLQQMTFHVQFHILNSIQCFPCTMRRERILAHPQRFSAIFFESLAKSIYLGFVILSFIYLLIRSKLQPHLYSHRHLNASIISFVLAQRTPQIVL